MADEKLPNARVAELLQEHGDGLDVPREVQHWAYFASPEGRDRFIALLGIRFERIEPFESTYKGSSLDRHAVTFWHVGLPDEESMTAITEMLSRFAQECGGKYDGWETQVLDQDGDADTPPHPDAD